jgi:hypothetical protein
MSSACQRTGVLHYPQDYRLEIREAFLNIMVQNSTAEFQPKDKQNAIVIFDKMTIDMTKAKTFSTAAVIIPPITDFYTTPHRLSALGAGILVNLLSKNNTNVYFFNFPLEHSRRKTVPLPDTLNYLTSHILPDETGRCSFFTNIIISDLLYRSA